MNNYSITILNFKNICILILVKIKTKTISNLNQINSALKIYKTQLILQTNFVNRYIFFPIKPIHKFMILCMLIISSINLVLVIAFRFKSIPTFYLLMNRLFYKN